MAVSVEYNYELVSSLNGQVSIYPTTPVDTFPNMFNYLQDEVFKQRKEINELKKMVTDLANLLIERK